MLVMLDLPPELLKRVMEIASGPPERVIIRAIENECDRCQPPPPGRDIAAGRSE